MLDTRLLIQQQMSFGMSMISPALYWLADDKSEAKFHDSQRFDLFFIKLNEYLNTKFKSPIANGTTTIFHLLIDACLFYKGDPYFDLFNKQIQDVNSFFFKKRHYEYYISPYDIYFELSLAEIINFQANYSKHSFYHLDIMKKKLSSHFKKNNIKNFELEDYNDHYSTFKEAVIDDRLDFNTTHIVEITGNHFLNLWDLLNCPTNKRIQDAIWDFINKNGRTKRWNIQKPDNLSFFENFFWEIRGIHTGNRDRIKENIPITNKILIEKESSESQRINRR